MSSHSNNYVIQNQGSNTNNTNGNSNNIDEQNFQVYIRIRPLTQRELNTQGYKSPMKLQYQNQMQAQTNNGNNLNSNTNNYQNSFQNNQNNLNSFAQRQQNNSSIIKVDPNKQILYVNDPEYKNIDKREKPYIFNGVFDEMQSNTEIFDNCCQPNLQPVLQGYNATFFAYGITGSGKTHTIFGNPKDNIDKGICFQSMNYIMNSLMQDQNKETIIKFSFMEIYNETVRDLLGDPSKNLTIIEDPIKGVQVQELREIQIDSAQKVEDLIIEGNNKRALAPTSQNQYSSRSHAILLLNIEFREKDSGKIYNSKLTFIDLAGSEKGGITSNTEKQAKGMLEGANINKSLLSLGNCINILAEKKKNAFVPYRDSKLTRILKDTLGGNTKTVMISCISQHFSCFEETMNTLNYSQRASNIKKKVYKNQQDESENAQSRKYKEIIISLKNELEIFQKIIKQPICCPNCGFINKELDNINSRLNHINTQQQQNTAQTMVTCQTENLETQVMMDNLAEEQNYLSNEIMALFKARNEKIQMEKQIAKEKLENIQLQLNFQNCDINKDQEQLYKDYLEKDQLKSKFKEEFLERVLKDLITNVEEKVKIQQGLKEIEEIMDNDRNKLQTISIQQQQQELTVSAMEVQEMLQINSQNEEIRNRMVYHLEVNEGQNDQLKDVLQKLHQENKTLILENEMKVQKQQLESLEMLQSNQELTQDLQIYTKQLDNKSKQIEELQNELVQIKQKMLFGDSNSVQRDSFQQGTNNQFLKKNQQNNSIFENIEIQQQQQNFKNNTMGAKKQDSNSNINKLLRGSLPVGESFITNNNYTGKQQQSQSLQKKTIPKNRNSSSSLSNNNNNINNNSQQQKNINKFTKLIQQQTDNNNKNNLSTPPPNNTKNNSLQNKKNSLKQQVTDQAKNNSNNSTYNAYKSSVDNANKNKIISGGNNNNSFQKGQNGQNINKTFQKTISYENIQPYSKENGQLQKPINSSYQAQSINHLQQQHQQQQQQYSPYLQNKKAIYVENQENIKQQPYNKGDKQQYTQPNAVTTIQPQEKNILSNSPNYVVNTTTVPVSNNTAQFQNNGNNNQLKTPNNNNSNNNGQSKNSNNNSKKEPYVTIIELFSKEKQKISSGSNLANNQKRTASKSVTRYEQKEDEDNDDGQESNYMGENPIPAKNFYRNEKTNNVQLQQGVNNSQQDKQSSDEENKKIIVISPVESLTSMPHKLEQDYVIQKGKQDNTSNNDNQDLYNNQYFYQNTMIDQMNEQNNLILLKGENMPIQQSNIVDDDCEIKLQSHDSRQNSEAKMNLSSQYSNNNSNIIYTQSNYIQMSQSPQIEQKSRCIYQQCYDNNQAQQPISNNNNNSEYQQQQIIQSEIIYKY